MKICLIGFGAMGKIVADMLGDDLALVVAQECEIKTLENVNEKFDCIIDFSNPNNLNMICDYVKKYNTPVVFATTGYTPEQIEMISNLSMIAPVLRSANFSLGVILLNRLVKQITPILKDDFDIEITEAHHHYKLDAPSGTAKMLLNSVVAATGYEPVYGRSGLQPRKPNEVGVHAIRGGTIVGEHDVMYCGEDEIITLKHSAHSKKVFAKGAIKASKWLMDKPNGLYDMEDVLFN